MDSEHVIDREHYVTIRDGGWRRGRDHGTVAARVAISPHPDFCEVAVLVPRDDGGLAYAARLIGSDQWAYFHHLQLWMCPLVEELLAKLALHGRLTELFEQAHRVLQPTSDD